MPVFIALGALAAIGVVAGVLGGDTNELRRRITGKSKGGIRGSGGRVVQPTETVSGWPPMSGGGFTDITSTTAPQSGFTSGPAPSTPLVSSELSSNDQVGVPGVDYPTPFNIGTPTADLVPGVDYPTPFNIGWSAPYTSPNSGVTPTALPDANR